MKNINTHTCFFITDLHGDLSKYKKLFHFISTEKPKAVFLGGDLLPNMSHLQNQQNSYDDFILDYLQVEFQKLKTNLKHEYPEVFIILGNDDPMIEEEKILNGEKIKLWKNAHNRKISFGDYVVYGYSFVPPTPFQLKDWEKYDVSRYVAPGCVSPEEGFRSIPIEANKIRYSTIKKDLDNLTIDNDLENSIFLFHSPPYNCNLDRAALDNKFVDYVPLDVHVGSIAIRRFLEEKKPHLSLHGHIHESFRLTGEWKETFGNTFAFSAAHDGNELALVKFNLNDLANATREHI